MKISDNSDKHLFTILPDVINENLHQKVENIRLIGGGSYGKVYSVVLTDGVRIAVKGYKLQGMQHEEAMQLKILSEHTSVSMPEVLFTYEDETTAVLAMSFVEGKNALDPAFLLKSKPVRQNFADAVIAGMLEWHSVENEKFGTLTDPTYDTWHAFYKAEKQIPWLSGLKELSENGKFAKKKLDLLQEATVLFNALPQETSKPVLIHADLNIMNIMVDPKDMKLLAFIDPCDSIWADREYDLYQLRNMWGDAFGLYETYKRKCALSDFADFRVAYYGAMHEAAMRLKGGHIVPLWEDLNFARLKKEMKKLKEMM